MRYNKTLAKILTNGVIEVLELGLATPQRVLALPKSLKRMVAPAPIVQAVNFFVNLLFRPEVFTLD